MSLIKNVISVPKRKELVVDGVGGIASGAGAYIISSQTATAASAAGGATVGASLGLCALFGAGVALLLQGVQAALREDVAPPAAKKE